MKRVFILLFMVVLVISATAQKGTDSTNFEIKDISKFKVSVTYQEHLSARQNAQLINYKKSKDLFSIKTYRKASRLRSKKVRVC